MSSVTFARKAIEIVKALAEYAPAYVTAGGVLYCALCSGESDVYGIVVHDEDCPYRMAVELVASEAE